MLLSGKSLARFLVYVAAFQYLQFAATNPLKIPDTSSEASGKAQTRSLDRRDSGLDGLGTHKNEKFFYDSSKVINYRPPNATIRFNDSLTPQNEKRVDIIPPQGKLPDGFYVADMMVVCESPEAVLSMTPEMYRMRFQRILKGHHTINLPDWSQRLNGMDQGTKMQWVWYNAELCQQCECHAPIASNSGMFTLAPAPESEGCPTIGEVMMCMLVFGCVCTEFLFDRQMHPEKGLVDSWLHFRYKKGKYLKGPPGSTIGPHNRGVLGLPEPQGSGSGSAEPPNAVSESPDCQPYSYRVLVPDTKEPYYLEGPSVENGPGCDSFGAWGGYGRHLGGGVPSVSSWFKRSKFKRDEANNPNNGIEIVDSHDPLQEDMSSTPNTNSAVEFTEDLGI
ncbi:hypothetical protein TWF281_001073 [Arthrobotrys megalospora]